MSTISDLRTALPVGTWRIDPTHSTIGFSVKHMVVANFRGGFETFDVALDGDGLRGTVEVASITVSEPNLNGHLLSPDFFDAERNPQLTFRSTAIGVSGDDLDIDGELTIKGVTRPVKITGTISGPVTHAFDGSSRLGLELETVIDRTAFGLDWNAPLPTGGFAVGNDVRLIAELELVERRSAMKILGIAGSLRADSLNRQLLALAADTLPEGVELALWDGLRDLPAFDQDDEATTSLPVAAFRSAVAGADAVLIATPEYNGSIPGALKNALDWGSRPRDTSAFRNVPVAVIGASPGAFGGVWAHAETRKVLGIMGARVVAAELSVGKAHEHLAAPDAQLRGQLRSVVDALVDEASARAAAA